MISYVGAGTQVAAFGSPVSPALPAGVQEGDLILLCIQVGTTINDGASPVPTATGYGLLLNAHSDDAPATQHCPILYKIAGASESDPSVAMDPVNAGWSVRAVAYRGVDPDNPIDTIAPLDLTGGASLTPPGITTKTDGAMVIAFAGFGNDDNPHLSVAQGFTSRVADQTAIGDNGYVLADQLVATAGAVTAPTFAQDTGTGVLAQLFALREEGQTFSEVNMIATDGVITGAATSLDVPLPVVVRAGDLIVLSFYHGNSSAQTFSATSFTDVGHVDNNGTLAMLAKVADGTEGSTITVTVTSATGGWTVSLSAFRNVDPDNPYSAAAAPVESTGASATTFTPTGITTTSDNAYVLSLVSGRNANGKFLNTAQGFALLAGNRGYSTTTGVDWGIGMAGKLIPTAGAVTCPTWEQSGSAVWMGITVALLPAPPILFVGAGTFVSGTTSPLAPTLPSHSEGDYILIMVTDRQGSGAVVTVSGYDLLGHFPSGQFVALPNGHSVWLFGKVAGASESTPSVVADAAVTAGWAAQCFVYSGTSGLDTGVRWNTNNTQSGNAAPPPTRAASDGAQVVAFGASYDDNTLQLLSGSEQGYTLRASNNNSSANMCMIWADKALTSAGDMQTGPTFEQTTVGPDTWVALGQFTLLPGGTTPSQPRLMRQLYGLGSSASTEQTMQFRYDLQADDLILVWVGTNDTTSTLAVTGFTQEIHAVGTTTRSLDMFYKVATGAETSVAITNPQGGFAWEATVQIWRGVDAGTPFDVANTENNAASGATFAGPSITPVTDHAVVVSAAALQAYPATPGFSNAQGFQPSFLGVTWQTGLSFDQSLFGGDKYVATAAATTAPTWSGISATWVGASTALRPAVGPTPTAPTNVAAVPQTSTSVSITWDDVAGEDNYRVERRICVT